MGDVVTLRTVLYAKIPIIKDLTQSGGPLGVGREIMHEAPLFVGHPSPPIAFVWLSKGATDPSSDNDYAAVHGKHLSGGDFGLVRGKIDRHVGAMDPLDPVRAGGSSIVAISALCCINRFTRSAIVTEGAIAFTLIL